MSYMRITIAFSCGSSSSARAMAASSSSLGCTSLRCTSAASDRPSCSRYSAAESMLELRDVELRGRAEVAVRAFDTDLRQARHQLVVAPLHGATQGGAHRRLLT